MMCIHIHFQEKKYFRKKTAEITRFDGTKKQIVVVNKTGTVEWPNTDLVG